MPHTDPFLSDLSGYVGNYGRVSDLDGLKQLIDRLYSLDRPIAFDVETGYTGPNHKKRALDVDCPHQFVVGFSLTAATGWARYIPLLHDFGDNLDPEQVWPLVQPLLEESPLIAHNWVFEARNLRALDRKGHGPQITLDWRKAHDSMVQSYVLSETPVHGLKELTRRRYGYDQAEIHSLFDKKLTAEQLSCLRFNTLDVNPQVINYVCDDVTWAWRLDQDQHQRCLDERATVYAVEREIMGILVDMADTGIHVDWQGLGTDLARFDYFYQQMEYRTRRMFEEATGRDLTALNFRSALQMRQLLFTDMGLHSSRLTKPNAKGEQSLSTDETALEALRHQHPAIDQLLKYRQVKKMGEWFQLWSGLRTAHDERVHPSLNQVRVQSGRFASDNPNVQNITKKWWFTVTDRDPEQHPPGSGDADFETHVKATGTNGIDYWSGNARDFLVASPGYTLLSFDYATAEMRILAGLSGEPHLLHAFQNDIDVHATAASLAFKVPIEQITKDHPLRQRAKAVNFGLIYGQGPKGLADGLGISKDEAKLIMDQYFAAFSLVDQWFSKVKAEGLRKGYVESFIGRKSTIWELQSSSEAVRSKADRMFVNIPVQGGAADYCKLAMIRSKRALVKQGWWGTQVRLLMNQHDSLVFEVRNDLRLIDVRDLLQPCVSFSVGAMFPTLPSMDVDWEWGQRWGTSAKLLADEPERPEPDDEIVIRWLRSATPEEGAVFVNTLRQHPGPHPVRVVIDGRSALLPMSISADINTVFDPAWQIEKAVTS